MGNTSSSNSLEAATSRIEDLAMAGGLSGSSSSRQDSPATPAAAPPAPPPPPPPPVVPAAPETPKTVIAFDDEVLDTKLKPFVDLTKSLGSPSVIEIVSILEKQYQGLRSFLLTSASCRQPDEEGLKKLLSPIQASIESITRCKDAGRKDREWFQHITIVGDGGLAVGWIVNPKPGPYIAEIKESVQYNGNRVIKEFKEKDQKHVEWVRGFIAILDAMRSYVMTYHTTGLVWNKQGVSVSEFNSASGAPPPPPPPPPPAAGAPAPAAAGGGAAAVFAQLNRGEEVTKGLRKVDKSEMTHKNPALRATGPVPSATGPPAKKPLKPTKPSSLSTKKPAKFALEGKNWVIEYQENQTVAVEDGQMSQAVNLFGCKNATVQIKGKVNAVTLVDCVKTSVLLESVVASISVTNSPSFAIQITGSAPMIQLDKTDSGQLYLSKDSLHAEITTSKCSAINVSLPVEGEELGVFEEHPVPEMLKTVVKNGKLVTSVVEHIGWHANRRAKRESEYTPHRGENGHYIPMEAPPLALDESFIGGFDPYLQQPSRPATPLTPKPPPLPPKDAGYIPGSQFGQISKTNSSFTSTFAAMSAVERSEAQRIPRMDPHLQFMVGPLLRYDTVERGVWRGAVLIVTSDSGSVYDPHPTLAFEWDPDLSPISEPVERPSYELAPHPSDPNMSNSLGYHPGHSPTNGDSHGPNYQKEQVPGHEIWCYVGTGRTSTFWRFSIEIPLSPSEMAVSYTINNGQPFVFYVPGLGQNMRWATYSCNGFSAGINPDDFRGPGYNSGYDPLWHDLLAKHAEKPFHLQGSYFEVATGKLKALHQSAAVIKSIATGMPTLIFHAGLNH
ncbi:C-CAP/cofactor C-like domain-containing protein [Mycena chlorophos]|uniref:Adenylyl cyclase-associated protein n=1 Tax=Mycena chlorophos TaxID=658473 RepID=A0A8H6TU36_MYCCL|nr:C-CAP/cofactor C-like domain-containing protein [Mycena chlorophos]